MLYDFGGTPIGNSRVKRVEGNRDFDDACKVEVLDVLNLHLDNSEKKDG